MAREQELLNKSVETLQLFHNAYTRNNEQHNREALNTALNEWNDLYTAIKQESSK